MDRGRHYNRGTVEEVLLDFKGHRAAMIKALTIDVEECCRQCDPYKENLCLCMDTPLNSGKLIYPLKKFEQ
ncbi:hypothetical protein S245_026747 [Arachis hypogaea]